MNRLIARLLILFVLFTHSSMAMDVYLSDTLDQNISSLVYKDKSGVDEQTLCMDVGGHCSHHQAHTTGLFPVAPFSEMQSNHVLFHKFQASLAFTDLIPIRRPPRT